MVRRRKIIPAASGTSNPLANSTIAGPGNAKTGELSVMHFVSVGPCNFSAMVFLEMPSMATREDLDGWLIDALKAQGGRGSIVDLCKHIWEQHETELKNSGSLLFTWQYDVRWAANRLRRKKIMRSVEDSPPHYWELASTTIAAA